MMNPGIAFPSFALCGVSRWISAILLALIPELSALGCSGAGVDQADIPFRPAPVGAGPASPVLGWIPPARDFTPPLKVLPSGATGSVLDFGAKCDGSTDDRAAIQQALDTVTVVQFPPGAVCVVHASGRTVMFSNTPHRYALSIPSNRAIYLNGSTIKIGNGQNAHVFVNSNLAGAGNSHIAILGPGTIDLNKANQTGPSSGEQSGGFMDQVAELTVRDITFTQVREYALRHFRISRGYYDNLICTGSDGSCFAFGIAGVGGPTDSYFGHIEAHEAAGISSPGAQGNPFISYGINNVLKSFVGTGNRFGFKLQDGAANWTIGRIHVEGTKADKGLKIMGVRGGPQTSRVSIGTIVTFDNYHEGLYIWESDDIAIGRIVSKGDAAGAASPAVTIASTANRIAVKSISVQESKAGGVSIEGTDVDIDEIYARNNGLQLAGQENVAIHSTAQRVRARSLITVDDQRPATVDRGLGIHAGAADVGIESFLPLGSFVTNQLVNEGSNVRIVDYTAVSQIFTDGDTTPSVRHGTLFKTGNSGSTTITNFEDGAVDQEITVLCGDVNTRVADTDHLKLTATMDCTPGNILRLYFDGATWIETGRTLI